MKHIVAGLLICLTVSNLVAQDNESVLHQLSAKYASLNSLHAKILIRKSNSPDFQTEIWFDANRSRMVTQDMEMMLNASHFIVVDKEGKRINLQKRDASQIPQKNYQLPVDSLINMSHSITVDTVNNSSMVVAMELNHPVVQEMTITTDMALNLKVVEYVFASQGINTTKMEMHYTLFETNPDLSQGQFDLSNYVEGTLDSLRPATTFSDYHLNQIPTAYSN